MVTGTTSSGFEYSIDERVFKSWAVVSLLGELAKLEESDSTEIDFINVMAELERNLFTDKGKALEKHIKAANDGFAPTAEVLKNLIEIVQSSQQLKN